MDCFRCARVVTLVLVVAMCCTLAGCAKSKLTPENYAKIEKDMSLREVERILGDGTPAGGDGSMVAAQAGVDVGGGLGGARQSSTVEYHWQSGDKVVKCFFQQDKLTKWEKKGF